MHARNAIGTFPLFGLVLGCATIPTSVTGKGLVPETQVEMAANRWETNGDVTFLQSPGFPHGILSVKGGSAELKALTFGDGTIEYDINEYADDQGIAGIWFRQQGAEIAENVYLRPDPQCPNSVECIQYAPVSHGNVQWDVYPEYQAGAPVKETGWNHVKLVVSGKRMNVFVNGESSPSLVVGNLAADALAGAVQLRGDAMFANLSITPGAVEGLSPAALPDPTDADPRFVRHWLLSKASSLPRGQEPALAERPADVSAWEAIVAERKGFVNISRKHGTARGVPDLIWLETKIDSDRAQEKRVSLGWAREIWVYVNGNLVFADKNLYYPASGRKPPLGRMSLENGSFALPLSAGSNEVTIAISNDLGSNRHWGWGFEFQLSDVEGVALPGTLRDR